MTTKIRPFYGPTDWPYVKPLISCIRCEDTCGVICYDDKTEEIYGAAIFDSFTPNSAQCHIGITSPIKCLRHGLLQASADYVFHARGRNKIFGLTPANNSKAVNFNKNIGWREVTRLKDAYTKEVDYIVFEMNKEECPYLRVIPRPRKGEQMDMFKHSQGF